MSRTFHMVSALVTGLVLLAPGVAAASEGPAPTAVIAGVSTFEQVGPAVRLDGSGSHSNGGGGTLSYRWTITDPAGQQVILDGAIVSFTFPSAGAYHVQLEVSDDGGADVAARDVNAWETQKTFLILPRVFGGPGPPQTTVSATLVSDPQGEPVPNQRVSFSFVSIGGSGAPEGCEATTDAQGVASCRVTFTLPGSFFVKAFFNGHLPALFSASATNIASVSEWSFRSTLLSHGLPHVGDPPMDVSGRVTADDHGQNIVIPFQYGVTLTGPGLAGEQDTRSGDGDALGLFEARFPLTRRGVYQLDLSVRERFVDGSLGVDHPSLKQSAPFTVYQRTELSVAELSGPPGAPLTASATLDAVRFDANQRVPVPNQLVSFSFTGSGAPGDCQARTDEQGVARCPVTFSSRGRYTAHASFAAYDFFDEATASREVAIGATPPTIAPLVTGTRGTDGWYTSDVTLGWSVSEELFPETLVKSGCGDVSVTSDQAATGYTCSASSAGGSAEPVTVTIKRDATNPTVTYANNAGSYGLQDTVAITCAAADNLSGLASTTCTNTQDAAWTLGPGEHTLSATATDAAGNVGSNSTRFTVVVTPASLCQLTTQLVKGSPAYLALTPKEQKTLDKRAEGLCAKLVRIVPKLSPSEKAQLVSAVKDEIQSLVPTWLTQDQANKLKTLADAL